METFRLSPYENSGSFRVTSPIGYRTDPITKEGIGTHYGLDLVGKDTQRIVSLEDGVVVRSRMVTDRSDATWQWGNYVAVKNSDGYIFYYCHLAERLVRAGDTVACGTPIGIEGATGLVTGRHLHLEMRHGSRVCDLESIDADPCSAAAFLGIPNAVGTYTSPICLLDNTPSEWSADAVRWAIKNRILRGDENGNFLLRAPCSREEALVFQADCIGHDRSVLRLYILAAKEHTKYMLILIGYHG